MRSMFALHVTFEKIYFTLLLLLSEKDLRLDYIVVYLGLLYFDTDEAG